MKLSQFSVIAEHPEHFEIGHPAGKMIKVPKKGLSPKAVEHISKMKRAEPVKMADGGEVVPKDDKKPEDQSADSKSLGETIGKGVRGAVEYTAPIAGALTNPGQAAVGYLADHAKDLYQGATGFIHGLLTSPAQAPAAQSAAPGQAGPTLSNPTALTQAPAAAPNQMAGQAAAPSGPAIPNPVGLLQAGYGQEVQGAKDYANAMGAAGNAQAQAAQNLQTQMDQYIKAQDVTRQKLTQDVEAAGADYAKGHIDPMKFWNDKSAASKVSTAFGLILGGIGGGLTHSDNAALKFLESNMQKSLESQIQDSSIKNNVYRHNLELLGNHDDATKLTLSQMMEAYKVHLNDLAAQSVNPTEQARAKMLIGQMSQKQGELLMPVSQRQAAMSMLKGSGGQGVDPGQKLMLLEQSGLVPKDQIEAARKELPMAMNHVQQVGDIMSQIDKVANENTVLGRTGRLGAEPPSVGVLQNLIMPYLKDAEGRINSTEIERVDKLLPKPGDRESTVQAKKEGMKKFLEEKGAFPNLRALGIEFHPKQVAVQNRYSQK